MTTSERVPSHGVSPGSPEAQPLIAAKLTVPRPRRTDVPRRSILDKLEGLVDRNLVVVRAPAGYGKTTVLAQWVAGRDRTAWVSLDDGDNDVVLLWRYVTEALIRGGCAEVADAVATLFGPAPDIVAHVVPRVAEALGSQSDVTIVLDDYHRIADEECDESIRRFIELMPANVLLAIGTRAVLAFELADLVTGEGSLELVAADLAFDASEASDLLALEGWRLAAPDFERMIDRTEGWPVGVYLAMLAGAGSTDPESRRDRPSGAHDLLAEYLVNEVLDDLSEGERTFLRETSMLAPLSGPLCDAVVGRDDSLRTLEDLSRRNVLLRPLRDGEFVYHHLFAQLLYAGLEADDPDRLHELHRRAARFHVAHQAPDDAFPHAIAGDDRTLAGRLLCRYFNPYAQSGRIRTILSWLLHFEEDEIATNLQLTIVSAWIHALVADVGQARRLTVAARSMAEAADLSEPAWDGSTSLESSHAILIGHVGARGTTEMRRACERVIELEPESSVWHPVAQDGLAWALAAVGDFDQALAVIELVRKARPNQGFAVVDALTCGGVVAFLREDRSLLARIGEEAERLVESHNLERTAASAQADVLRAAHFALAGDAREAVGYLERAEDGIRFTAPFTYASVSMQAIAAVVSALVGRSEAATAYAAAAREAMAWWSDDPGMLPDLVEMAEAAHGRTSSDAQPAPQEPDLTTLEERLLAALRGPLTLGEIAVEFGISYEAARSHRRSLYAKLGVNSRAAAIRRATELRVCPRS